MSAINDTTTPQQPPPPHGTLSAEEEASLRVARSGPARISRAAGRLDTTAVGDLAPASPRAARPETVSLFGLPVLAVRAVEAIDEIRVAARASRVRLAYVNAHTLNLAHRDPGLRDALHRCDIVLNDGAGVALAARLHGRRFPENLQGTDFNLRLLRLAAEQRWSVFLLGARPGIAQRAAVGLSASLPDLRIAGTRHGFHRDPANDLAVVRASGAQMLMVAKGSPRQELWLAQHFDSVPRVRLGVGVGAFLDFQAGVIPRAPAWMIARKVEWLYRLRCEPRRMAGRYLLGNPSFVARAVRDAARPAAQFEKAVR